MMGFLAWLDDRTGYRSLVHDALFEHIPGGARWRYVWGSTLVFAFVVQIVTGVILWSAYSPSAQTAWESVYYIQHDMTGGWLLRGVHHFMAHAMVVLLAIHFVQVVVDGAYRAPREINFWIGLVMMQLVLGLALTGYLAARGTKKATGPRRWRRTWSRSCRWSARRCRSCSWAAANTGTTRSPASSRCTLACCRACSSFAR